jgi:hypothetical protein
MTSRSVLLAFAAAGALATPAHAAVTFHNDMGSFLGAGTITQSFDFDSFSTGTFSFPGDPYTVGDITFTSTNNLIVGAGTYGNPRNALANNFWTPLPGTISGAHNLFGFNLGFAGSGPVDVLVNTNLGSYTFANVVAPFGGFAFQGFQAGPGEYFTGFSIAALYGTGNLPLTTDYRLGTSGLTGAVPEPSAWAMMILGFGIVGGAMRSAGRRTKVSYATA